ncbi:winged helix-turn-helix domain-containing protein [Candidatus Bathyarchaeota archaeon]|nr:winged helix-turn-helix domain-containing protein [Candidatus Bathyarchaeota archaeon]
MASTYRRSRVELYVDILQAIANGRESPARIVYAANLSYDRVVKCLDFLEDQSLIQRSSDTKKRRYKVVSKGMDVLRYFGEVQTALFYKNKTINNINIHYTKG